MPGARPILRRARSRGARARASDVRKIRLTIAYDGADFHGWQRQPGRRTVQGALEDSLRRVLREPINLRGASRTDAGVHARGQVAHFTTSASIPLDRLALAVTHRLPPDLTIVRASPAPEDFDASRDAIGKLYRYRIFHSERRPVERLSQRFTWHIWRALDFPRLRAAAAEMTGRRDFAGFASRGSPRQTTVRTVRRIDVSRAGPELILDVEGDGFLYNQVRNMIGTLIEIGRGHWPVSRVREILDARDRTLAGPTAPACGLTLEWVRYARPEWTERMPPSEWTSPAEGTPPSNRTPDEP